MLSRNLGDTELLERLAALEHKRWSGWEIYRRSKVGLAPLDGFESYEERWLRQIETPYEGLSETEKTSDRDEVRKILDVIFAYLTGE